MDGIYRRRRASDRARSLRSGMKRLNDETRRCPVEGCGKRPDGFSRYCNHHKSKLKEMGHPTLHLPVRKQHEYFTVLKLGRFLRRGMSKTPMDQRAWLRVEQAIARLAFDPRLNWDRVTMARRDKHLTNPFKAQVVIRAKLERTSAEDILASYLGMAAAIFKLNEIPMNKRQLLHCTHKAGGRAITRFAKTYATDPETGKVYRWDPSHGVLTHVGEFVERQIAKEFGEGWWRDAAVVMATVPFPNEDTEGEKKPGDAA